MPSASNGKSSRPHTRDRAPDPSRIFPLALVIPAADVHRQSFGCSDEADFTYFEQALNETRDFVAAFERATELVEEREAEENVSPPFAPQIHAPDAAVEHLRRWLAQFED